MINPDRIIKIYSDCRCGRGEWVHVSTPFLVDSLNRRKLAKHREEIILMLNELPDNLKRSNGGLCFSEMYYSKDCKNKWTESFYIIRLLISLGMAIGTLSVIMDENYDDPYLIMIND